MIYTSFSLRVILQESCLENREGKEVREGREEKLSPLSILSFLSLSSLYHKRVITEKVV